MPLIKSKSEKAFHSNIREMVKAGHPVKVAVAAAYHEKEQAAHEHHKTRHAKGFSSGGEA
jgi:hypothetical protein